MTIDNIKFYTIRTYSYIAILLKVDDIAPLETLELSRGTMEVKAIYWIKKKEVIFDKKNLNSE